MFLLLLINCALFNEFSAAPLFRKGLLRDELQDLEQSFTELRSPFIIQRPRSLFIIPERPKVPTHNKFPPQVNMVQNNMKPDKPELNPDAYNSLQNSDLPGKKDIKVLVDLGDDPYSNGNIAVDEINFNQIKYDPMPVDEEADMPMVGMGRQGFNPFSLLSGLLGSPQGPNRQGNNALNNEPYREKPQGLLNGLLTLPEIFLSIT